nr:hypothetical protein [Streptomyces sp. DSM 41633]
IKIADQIHRFAGSGEVDVVTERRPAPCSEPNSVGERLTDMDNIARAVIREDGLDPDDPDVGAAIDLVRWELECLGQLGE